MNKGDRVALRTDRSWLGTVTATPAAGKVRVSGDGGWSGVVDAEALVPVEDKAWPPAGMEHK